MYRNLAVLSGKMYISWQAQKFGDTDSAIWKTYTKQAYHFSNQSSFEVDVKEFSEILNAASMVVRGSRGAAWVPANANKFTTDLTPWSDHRNRLVQAGMTLRPAFLHFT